MNETGEMFTDAEHNFFAGSGVNLQKTFGWLQARAFRALNTALSHLPGGRFRAFGSGPGQIGKILVINLERQPSRLRRTLRELNRFGTASGVSLISITTRLVAVDARDGRAVASTADVDPAYVLGDQIFVQPDERLENCFGVDEPVTMTRQEVAVARSHIEAWKAVAEGTVEYVLILEDDIWFRPRARSAIDRGWVAAKNRFPDEEGPEFLYLSYSDAGGTADRQDICQNLFRPKRGLWFLSGYVISRRAAHKLLRAMPVKGPVDMWINRRFDEIRTLALSSPAILQRRDGGSDNSYSILPYLARAGVADADAVAPPPRVAAGPLFVWCDNNTRESVAMALSMLGLRVRVFDEGDAIASADALSSVFEDFDALITPPILEEHLADLVLDAQLKFLIDRNVQCPLDLAKVSRTQVATLSDCSTDLARWIVLCNLLSVTRPVDPFPIGTPSEWRLFRDDRDDAIKLGKNVQQPALLSDHSAWALTPKPEWPADPDSGLDSRTDTGDRANTRFVGGLADFMPLDETFPGNLASFQFQGVKREGETATLTLSRAPNAELSKPYHSGALVSPTSHLHGRFEADIKAARGEGLVTGFFLHRAGPRQEIDFEITGDDPTSVLLNVYFNPGDIGASAAYGYRGSPCRISLGFDASTTFHRYAVEWRPDCILWSVDGRIIHRRGSWDPTPVPHLPMKIHFNLWAPRSRELAGHLATSSLPAKAGIRNIRITR